MQVNLINFFQQRTYISCFSTGGITTKTLPHMYYTACLENVKYKTISTRKLTTVSQTDWVQEHSWTYKHAPSLNGLPRWIWSLYRSAGISVLYKWFSNNLRVLKTGPSEHGWPLKPYRLACWILSLLVIRYQHMDRNPVIFSLTVIKIKCKIKTKIILKMINK